MALIHVDQMRFGVSHTERLSLDTCATPTRSLYAFWQWYICDLALKNHSW
jgi:hypothetical protein